MKRTLKLLIIFAAALFTACIQDNSTGFELDMPAVKIANDDGIAAEALVEKTYAPVIEWAGTSPEEYDYLWTINGKEEICHEQVLKYVFTQKGDVFLTFQMTHKQTKLCYGCDFKVTVSNPYTLGWLILSEDSSKNSILSFVHMTSFEATPDIYGAINNGEVLGRNPKALVNHCIKSEDQILVVQDNPVEISGVNFTKKSETKHEFIGGDFPTEEGGFEMVNAAYTHKGTDLILSKNGKVYTRVTPYAATSANCAFQDAMYSPVPFASAAGDAEFTYTCFPGNLNYQLLFDNKNKRWLAYYNSTTIPRTVPAFVKGFTGTTVFDFCNGMPSDVDLVYAQTYGESSNNTNLICLFKQGSNYFVSQSSLKLATATYKITVNPATQVAFNQPLDAKSKFCLMRGTSTVFNTDPYLFFSIGKKVYFYRWSTRAVNLFKDFSKGSNAPSGDIVSIQQNGTGTQVGVAFSDGHFYICDSDKTKILQNIANGNINPEGDNDIELAHITNIPGKTVNAIFKFGSASNITTGKIAY